MTQQLMKAVVCPKYGSPDVLSLSEVPKPSPKSNEILIKTVATTVSHGDVRIRGLDVPKSIKPMIRFVLGFKGPRNNILGLELAGIVEEVGRDVTKFQKGDHVLAATLQNFGGYAHYKCLPEKSAIAFKPPSVTFEQAAAIPIGARTALHYLRRSNLQEGQKILIYGASGSVGTYAIQLAKYIGAHVTAVSSKTNESLVKSLGADEFLNYQTSDFNEKLDVYDTILVTIGNLQFTIGKEHLTSSGVYMNVSEPMKSLEMIWTSLTTSKKVVMAENSEESAEDLQFLINMVGDGKLKPVIDSRYRLDEMVEAHRYVESRRKKGNVVVLVD